MRDCTTHHHACDCREAYFKKETHKLIEATAELIYLRLYAAKGGLWDLVETKDVWREKARDFLTKNGRTK